MRCLLVLIISFLFFNMIFAEDLDYSYLMEYFNNPLKINIADKETLLNFPFFDEQSVKKFLKIRKKRTLVLEDLESIKADFSDFEQIIDFDVPLKKSYKLSSRLVNFKNFKDKIALDNMFEMQINNWKINLLSQKDKNEKNWFDYYSYSASYKNPKNKISQIILGNYKMYNSQGLFLGRIGSMTKSRNSVKFNKTSLKISPNFSFMETGKFNGLVFSFNFDNFIITPFFSTLKQDVKIRNNLIYAFDFSGDHSQKIKQCNEQSRGFSLIYKKENFIINYLFARVNYSGNQVKQNLLNNDVSFFLKIRNVDFFGEYLLQEKNRNSALIGVKINRKKLKHLISMRNYNKNLISFRGNPISEKSVFYGEKGIYNGLEYKSKKIKINVYYDYFWFENNFQKEFFYDGNESLISLEKKYKKILLITTFKYQKKQKTKKINGCLEENKEIKNNFSNTISLSLKKDHKIKLRFVYNKIRTKNNNNSGTLFYIQHEVKNKNLTIINRLTSSFAKIPVYLYENNVSGIFQNKIFLNDNLNWFIFLKFKLKIVYIQTKFDYNLYKKNNNLYLMLGSYF